MTLDTVPGVVCFQLIQSDPQIGALVRVFPGVHVGDVGLGDVPMESELFFTYVALGAFRRAGLVQRIGSAPAPAVPTMRLRGQVDNDGRVLWWLLVMPDGRRQRCESLSGDQERLSIREVISADDLHERVRTGWTAAVAEQRRLEVRAQMAAHGRGQALTKPPPEGA